MKTAVSSAFAFFLACGCGSGGAPTTDFDDPVPLPAGIPRVAGGFTNWYDHAETVGHVFGVINFTPTSFTRIEMLGVDGTDVFDVSVSAQQTWLNPDVGAGFYLLVCHGQDGNLYERYVKYQPEIGWDAFYLTRSNWTL